VGTKLEDWRRLWNDQLTGKNQNKSKFKWDFWAIQTEFHNTNIPGITKIIEDWRLKPKCCQGRDVVDSRVRSFGKCRSHWRRLWSFLKLCSAPLKDLNFKSENLQFADGKLAADSCRQKRRPIAHKDENFKIWGPKDWRTGKTDSKQESFWLSFCRERLCEC
jgi:hypothetical protein